MASQNPPIKTDSKLIINGIFLLEKFPGKGGWTYAALPKLIVGGKTHFGWLRVRGTIDDYEIKQYNLAPMGNGNLFLPVRAEIRKKIGKQVGDKIHVALYIDDLPLEIPEELMICLKDEPEAYAFFMNSPESRQKEIIKWVYAAKTLDERVERIVVTLKKLADKRKK